MSHNKFVTQSEKMINEISNHIKKYFNLVQDPEIKSTIREDKSISFVITCIFPLQNDYRIDSINLVVEYNPNVVEYLGKNYSFPDEILSLLKRIKESKPYLS